MVADLHFRATTFPRKGGSRGGGGGPCPRPPSLACAIFFARHGCWRSDIPRGLHPSALSTELLKVSELPHLSLTLTLAQPRCNCKCNLTLILDSRYNGRHALAWDVSAVTSEAARILQSPASAASDVTADTLTPKHAAC